MSATIRIDDKEVTEFLHALLQKTGNLTPLMDEIGAEMETRVSSRFETQSDPLGAPWAAWAPATKLSYPDDGNGRVLDRHGHMLDSLGHQADESSVTYGFALDYAAYHEFGTDTMPKRSMLMADPEAGTLSDDDQRAVLETIEAYFSPR